MKAARHIAEASQTTLQSGAVAGALAGNAGALSTLALLGGEACGEDTHFYGGVKHQELGALLHPLQFRVYGDVYVGCVVGNLTLAVFFCLLYLAVVRFCRPRLERQGRNPLVYEIRFALPALLISIMVVFHQGSTYATAHLLFRRSTWSDGPRVVAGVLGLLTVGGGLPLLVWAKLLRGAGRMALWETDGARALHWFFLGGGEWCSLPASKRWHVRYGYVLWPYKPHKASGAMAAQLAEVAVLSAIAGIEKHGRSQCMLAQGAYALVVLLHGFWCWFSAPYARPRDALYELITTLTISSAMVCRLVAYARVNQQASASAEFEAASVLLLVAAVVTTTNFTVEWICWGYLSSWGPVCGRTWTGRRQRLQQLVDSRAAPLVTQKDLSESSLTDSSADFAQLAPISREPSLLLAPFAAAALERRDAGIRSSRRSPPPVAGDGARAAPRGPSRRALHRARSAQLIGPAVPRRALPEVPEVPEVVVEYLSPHFASTAGESAGSSPSSSPCSAGASSSANPGSCGARHFSSGASGERRQPSPSSASDYALEPLGAAPRRRRLRRPLSVQAHMRALTASGRGRQLPGVRTASDLRTASVRRLSPCTPPVRGL